jgi:hypothetical protein
MESSNMARSARLGLCVLACALASAGAHAQVFKCTDDSGKVNYTDQPCADSHKSEEITVHAPPPQSPEDRKAAEDYERELQQKRVQRERAEREKLNQGVADAKAEVKKIKSENYNPEKCRSAQSKMAAMKRRDPIGYRYELDYFEYQQWAELYCGN